MNKCGKTRLERIMEGALAGDMNLCAQPVSREEKALFALADVACNKEGGGGIVKQKDVNFYDYDGTLLHSYTLDEISKLNAIPSPPDHSDEELVSYGWNFKNEEIKAFDRPMDVGAVCGWAHDGFMIEIEVPATIENMYRLRFGLIGKVLIEWGDGSSYEHEDNNLSPAAYIQHCYSEPGVYQLKVTPIGDDPSSCEIVITGNENDGSGLLNIQGISGTAGLSLYRLSGRKLFIGGCVSKIGDYGLANLHFDAIAIPNTITEMGAYAFRGCTGFSHVSIPDSIKNIDEGAFSQCNFIRTYAIGHGVTAIGKSAFSGATALKRITIPDNVASLGKNAFSGCTQILDVIFPKTLATIGETVFGGVTNLRKVTFVSNNRDINAHYFGGNNTLSVIKFVGSTSNILSGFFGPASNVLLYDFSEATAIPTIAMGTFDTSVEGYRIAVPASMYDEWIAAENWSNYADVIYPV